MAGQWRGAVFIALTLTMLTSACSSGSGSAASARHRPAGTATSPTSRQQPSASPSAGFRAGTVRPGRPPTSDVGALPQTTASPVADVQFATKMAALWQAVQAGRPTEADAAFFPEAAYLQLKSIHHPRADYASRLIGQFHLDLLAAHALLGPNPAAAKFLGVAMPSSGASWVPPGGCYNRIGYWHVSGARVRYRLGAVVHSFAIALLISWRGQWYVVHLGAITEKPGQGTVDAPLTGPGRPGVPAGPC